MDLSDTMNGITNSINNGEFSSLQGYSEVLMMSTDMAIKENENYNLSPKCSEVNEEWIAGLQDYNSGAKHLRVAAIDAQNGIVNKEEFSMAAELCGSGTEHMENAGKLLDAIS